MFIRTLSTLVFLKVARRISSFYSVCLFFSKKVSKRKDGYLLQTDQQSYSIDQLVLASGHWENDETEEERVWVDYAKKNVLLYQLPSNPADVDLSKIPPKENVF